MVKLFPTVMLVTAAATLLLSAVEEVSARASAFGGMMIRGDPRANSPRVWHSKGAYKGALAELKTECHSAKTQLGSFRKKALSKVTSAKKWDKALKKVVKPMIKKLTNFEDKLKAKVAKTVSNQKKKKGKKDEKEEEKGSDEEKEKKRRKKRASSMTIYRSTVSRLNKGCKMVEQDLEKFYEKELEEKKSGEDSNEPPADVDADVDKWMVAFKKSLVNMYTKMFNKKKSSKNKRKKKKGKKKSMRTLKTKKKCQHKELESEE